MELKNNSIFLTNFDFELTLEQEKYQKPKANKINMSLDSLFLWCAKANEILYSKNEYSYKFLSYIKTLRGYCPTVSDSLKEDLELWWGEFNDIESWKRQKAINSKFTSFECRNELGLDCCDSFIARARIELNDLDFTNKYLAKSAFGFSAKGQKALHEIEDTRDIKFPILIEKKLNRIRDYGIVLNDIEYCIIENLNDTHGQFRGALFDNDIDTSFVDINKFNAIYKWYKNKFVINSLQIDFFEYLENSKLEINYLCEVNHRKSMGLITKILSDQFAKKLGLFLMFPKKKVKSFSTFDDKLEELSQLKYSNKTGLGTICLSEFGGLFECYFISHNSRRELQFMISELWKKIRKENEPLANEFIINF